MPAGVASLPGPLGHPPIPGYRQPFSLQAVRRWRADPLSFFTAMCEEFGDVCQWRIGPVVTVVLRDPAHVKRVLVDNHRNYGKGARGWKVMRSVFGNGLLTSEGDFWLRQRRIAQPAFHRQCIAGFADTMAAETQRLLGDWKRRADPSQPLDVHNEMMRLTLRVVVATLFGRELETDTDVISEAIGTLLTALRWRVTHLTPDFVPVPINVRRRRAERTLDAVVYGIIRARRANGDRSPDLLGMLMAAEDPETGETMTDRQLRDEVMTMFLAGHETTANALSWTFYLLSKHPDAARRLMTEVDEQIGDSSVGMAELSKLPYTQTVLQEAMRLYPPAWAIPRVANEQDSVGGYTIPKGAGVVVSPYLTQRDPRVWENPEGFDPDRFAEDRLKQLPKFAYFPFGGGPRLCIGKSFAMLEATIALAMITRRYRLDLLPGERVVPQPAITLRPRDGLLMRLHARD